MPNSKVKLTMQVEQEHDKAQTAYETNAYFLEKAGKFFLFFDEENEDNHITKCRFEISDDTLRIRRNGPIFMEQTHVKHQKTTGYMKTPFGHIATEVQTFQLSFIQQMSGHYELKLNYDLYTDNEKTGTYSLAIIIQSKEDIGS
ncbi:MAG: DUF1934 domain-containing protein [Defluviitaleaceae bacterium]|nr:DUF1934 domain-containing protein [Defluviitaleaceae bacterium]